MPPSRDRPLAADHPAAAGHFPGNPIMPGALLLDEVLQAVSEAEGVDIALCQLRSAKFLRPVGPGDTLTIRWSARAGGEIRFDGLTAEEVALTGTLRIEGR